jgi:Protein of unknown function (DUF3604)
VGRAEYAGVDLRRVEAARNLRYQRNAHSRAIIRWVELSHGLDKRQDLVQAAYKGGVPMGGELHGAHGRAPRLVVWAVKDSNSANLQKIQIVKGWSKGTETFEKVFDVACSDGRQPDLRSHKCPDNGATVSLSDCSVTANKGAAELSVIWTDPEFNKVGSRILLCARAGEPDLPLEYGGRAAGQGSVVVEVPGHDSGTRLEFTDLVHAGRPLRQWLRKQALRIAVISDIHGNLSALEAVLADISQCGVDIMLSLTWVIFFLARSSLANVLTS